MQTYGDKFLSEFLALSLEQKNLIARGGSGAKLNGRFLASPSHVDRDLHYDRSWFDL